MREAVLDASVVLKWFAAEQRGSAEARVLRDDYRAGRLIVVVPALLFLELLNVTARRWSWAADTIHELARVLDELAFEFGEPALQSVAGWVVRGLTAYDATYVALAEARGLPLVTDDDRILAVAPTISRPLVGGLSAGT